MYALALRMLALAPATNTEIAQATGRSAATVYNAMQRLADRRQVTRDGLRWRLPLEPVTTSADYGIYNVLLPTPPIDPKGARFVAGTANETEDDE